MAYSIMRMQKIHTMDQMRRAYEHNYRVAHVGNADPSRKKYNEELVSLHFKDGKQMSYTEEWKERLTSLPLYSKEGGKKPRKNAVLAIEVMLTFSREHKDKIDIEKWKSENVKWLESTFNADKARYGNNVLSVVYHDDETGNVHCHALIQPIDEKGKLNAFRFTGGRENGISRYSMISDSYAEHMAQFDLQRGMRGSVSEHMTIKKFYAGLDQAINNVPLPKENELATDYYARYQEALETLSAVRYRESLKKKSDMEHRITEYSNHMKEAVTDLKKEVDDLSQKRDDLTERLGSAQEAVTYYESELEDLYLDDLRNAFSNDGAIYQTLAQLDAQKASEIQRQINDVLDLAIEEHTLEEEIR